MILWRPTLAAAACLILGLSLAGCKSTGSADADAKKGEKGKEEESKPADAAPAVDVSFLLSMSYSEAKTLSAQTMEVAPFYKIAADSIEVTRVNEDGTPKRVRAKGRVFIEMNYREPAKALCQELLVSEDEVILRGKPVLQRGGSTLEGVDDYTVFYMFGTKLRAIGPHRVANVGQMSIGPDGLSLPTLGAWTDAPNPLLPPLSESSVPESVRNELMRAAEAEMLHQQTRTQMGPAKETAPDKPEEPKKSDKAAPKPESNAKTKSKTSAAEAAPAKSSGGGFFSRLFGGKPKEEPKPEPPPAKKKKR